MKEEMKELSERDSNIKNKNQHINTPPFNQKYFHFKKINMVAKTSFLELWKSSN